MKPTATKTKFGYAFRGYEIEHLQMCGETFGWVILLDGKIVDQFATLRRCKQIINNWIEPSPSFE